MKISNYQKILLINLGLLVLALVLAFLIPLKPLRVVDVQLPDTIIDPQIQITFSDLIDRSGFAGNFKITPYLPGKISWVGKKMVFTPDQNLNYQDSYTISLETGIISERGTKLPEEVNLNFKMPEPEFLLLETSLGQGRLAKINVLNQAVQYLSPEGKVVKNYDYDQTEKRLLYLASTQASFENDQTVDFQIHLTDLNSVNPAPQILSEVSQNHYLHQAKWVPYENKLLITRTKLIRENGFVFLSNHEADRELILYDLNSGKIQQITTGNALVYEFYPTPDGHGVLFIDDQGVLVLHDLESGNEEILVNDFYDYFGFSEYGAYLLYTVLPGEGVFAFGNDLVTQDQYGGKNLLLKNPNGVVDHPSLSADEKLIVFKYYLESFEQQGRVNFVLAAKDLEQDRLDVLVDNSQISVEEPSLSPDGQRIVYLQMDFGEDGPIKAGYDDYNREFSGGRVAIFNLNDKSNKLSEVQGYSPSWIY
jgi:Tol biopolymer transport system component